MTMRRLALVLVCVAVSGCSFLSRSKSRFFTLDRVPPAAVTQLGGLPVGIDALDLPPAVDRKEVVVQQEGQKLEIRSAEQWSAPFRPLVLHTLAFDLASRLPDGMVVLPGAGKPAVMRSLDVAFEQLGAGPAPVVVVDARWTLRQAGRPDLSGHERIETPIASLESAAIADGTSRALGVLADRIVAGISR